MWGASVAAACVWMGWVGGRVGRCSSDASYSSSPIRLGSLLRHTFVGMGGRYDRYGKVRQERAGLHPPYNRLPADLEARHPGSYHNNIGVQLQT